MNPVQATRSLIERARALEKEDVAEAARLYREALRADPASIEASNALERLNDPERYSAWMRINCVIHPDDDIFAFIARERHNLNPIRDYLADGWRTLSELMVLLETIDRSLVALDSVLEFASGFGRFTRHLVRVLPGRVTCADVLPGSVEFVREQFGVEAFQSSFTPRELDIPDRYELVFVLSLLTHLPVEVWGDWLRVLARAVKPGGLLIFTVHNEDVARDLLGVEFDADGCRFLPSSESPSIDPSDYGTTFTTREVVCNEVRKALGCEPLHYSPSHFWIGHDAVVIAPPENLP